MAGIGVKLNKIYEKETLTTNLYGFAYSSLLTVAPMFVVILAILIMQIVLKVSTTGYAMRELYACTVLYIFIFALLSAAPFNSVLSRYLSDAIYEERYEDIMPCYYVGLFLNISFSSIFGIAFCIHEYMTGLVDLWYVFTGYCGYMALVMVFYSMLYLSICKDYNKISLYFLLGMIVTIVVSIVCYHVLKFEVTYSMLLGLVLGFLLIAILEYALIRHYFKENSGKYRMVFTYFKRYWQLIFTNFFYTLGLYIHNFVFWSTDLHMEVVKSFVCVTEYDMATCLAMFINISATIIFISRVEMNFHEKYKAYSEAVIGGRGIDIANAKSRMFRKLGEEIFSLVRIQFIISVVLYFLSIIFLPRFGFGGMVMQIYPCLAVGYFVLFLMYATIIFLYYFNDNNGALLTAIVFVGVTFITSFWATTLPVLWYGIGLLIGAICGFVTGYVRIQYVEKHMDIHTFCDGQLVPIGQGKKPSSVVYRKNKGEEL